MEQPGAIRPRLEVTTPVFEGPLELLLALAEREEIDIFQVSLAALTEAYLTEVARLEHGDPREMAEFLWLAARLLLLKSVRLLPGEQPDDEETELLGWEEDVRARLREYRVYREMAERLMQRVAAEPFSFSPPPRPVPIQGQEEPLRLEALVTAFQAVLSRLPPRPLVFVGTGWTLEDKLEAVERRLEAGAFDLVDMLLGCADRLEAVVTFVAVLELLRRGRIRVHQPHNFGRIMVEAA
ncbi:MAG TPA: segregation/condensation protein A [Candidatus Dormibacteraeota bacterium]|nr:segregation/condensation protein A [Candidatus Dormibacteraeota bacterium]